MPIVKSKSFAKINLYLEIIGKREDNYHLLDSIFAKINLYDEIIIDKSDNFKLKITNEEELLKNNSDLQQFCDNNIINKTVSLLVNKFKFYPRIAINLQKNIPLSSGLGGGSSNAATIILLLNHLYKLNLKQEELIEIGLEIGADVPFFLQSSSAAFVSGIGEIITPISSNFIDELGNYYFLIINPRKEISTSKVFSQINRSDWINNQKISLNNKERLIDFIKNKNNNLENQAIEIEPKIKEILDFIKKNDNCLLARMSGSGATCFAIFNEKKYADLMLENIKQHFGTNIFVTITKLQA